jgi:transposase InsO family protein
VVVDDFSRECLALVADRSLTGRRVARELDRIAQLRGLPTGPPWTTTLTDSGYDRGQQRGRVINRLFSYRGRDFIKQDRSADSTFLQFQRSACNICCVFRLHARSF